MRVVLWDPFTVPFMGRALVVLSILAVVSAAVSLFVLLRRLAFAADTLTHTVFPGVVIGYLVSGEAGVLWGALGAAVATALALTLLTRLSRTSDDAAMAILLTAMFSIGVVLVSRRASYTADLTAFLFGRVLTVTTDQIVQTAIVAGIALLALTATAKEQVLRAFDPEAARAAGYRVVWLDLVLNLVVALVVVAAVRAVGVLLVIALLVVPAAAGRLVTARLWLDRGVRMRGRRPRGLRRSTRQLPRVYHVRRAAGRRPYRGNPAVGRLPPARHCRLDHSRPAATTRHLRARSIDRVTRGSGGEGRARLGIRRCRVNWLDSYLHRAVVEVVLVGVLAGMVGVQVVLRRLAFFTMATTHATFPGVVTAAIIGISPYLGGAVAGLVVSGAVLAASRRRGQDTSTATGVVLATGFALGVALMSTQSGFTRNLTALLVGSVLTVDRADLVTAVAVTTGVAAVTVLLRKELLYLAFDPGGARAAGYPVAALELCVLVTVAAAVVTAVPAVGAILCVALIVAPAAAARLWTDRVAVMHAIAIVVAVGSGLAGLALSQRYNVAAGGAISLVAVGAFAISWLAAPRHGAIHHLLRTTHMHTSRRTTTTPASAEGTP